MNRDKEVIGSEAEGKLDDDIDALFKLPLAEFIGARNDLAARLKRAGRADDANLVKALAKPSISAWAVNQLHWRHREALDRLLVTGQRFREAQTSQTAGRIADMLGSLDTRRDALSQLSNLATVLLRDAGYNPTADTIHRITTTLEAVSAYAAPSDGPTPGRLTQDADPPGFESLSSLISDTVTTTRNDERTRVTPSQKTPSAAAKMRQEDKAEETRRARIAAAKLTVQEAKRSLTEAMSRTQRLEAAQKKAYADAKEADAKARQAEKQMREAEERSRNASASSQDAALRAQRIAAEAEEAAKAVEDAKRAVEKASKEFDSLS